MVKLLGMVIVLLVVSLVTVGLTTFADTVLTDSSAGTLNSSSYMGSSLHSNISTFTEEIRSDLGSNSTQLQAGEQTEYLSIPKTFNIMQKSLQRVPQFWGALLADVAGIGYIDATTYAIVLTIIALFVVGAFLTGIIKWEVI